MKSGNGAPRNSKIATHSNINFGKGQTFGGGHNSNLPWVNGKGPSAQKPKKKK
jgi:hypothetical protein